MMTGCLITRYNFVPLNTTIYGPQMTKLVFAVFGFMPNLLEIEDGAWDGFVRSRPAFRVAV